MRSFNIWSLWRDAFLCTKLDFIFSVQSSEESKSPRKVFWRMGNCRLLVGSNPRKSMEVCSEAFLPFSMDARFLQVLSCTDFHFLLRIPCIHWDFWCVAEEEEEVAKGMIWCNHNCELMVLVQFRESTMAGSFDYLFLADLLQNHVWV